MLDLVSPRLSRKAAVTNLSIRLAKGECLGLLGPNGAGKSTVVKMLCGIQTPDEGSVRVLGYAPYVRQPDFCQRIGVVFGHKCSLWWDLPVASSFAFCRSLYAIPRTKFERKMSELTHSLRLERILNQAIRSLSLGERVKVELACAMLHEPDLLMLDEPTVGLDIQAKAELRNHLNWVKRELGTSILLTSHDLGDIEACCDRVALLNNGTIELESTLDDFRHQLSDDMEFRIEPISTGYGAGDLVYLREWLKKHTSSAPTDIAVGEPTTFYIPRQDTPEAIQVLVSLSSVRFEIRRISFERALLNYFRDDKTSGDAP
ncbi:ATP-binding cassette domain-containing protein [Trinickia sp.]|uniref:ATP-binding cassette domain-containing protein n=1 Tax=Trinickia sp. TaxID=2571163 RepID=UPI003F7F2FEB